MEGNGPMADEGEMPKQQQQAQAPRCPACYNLPKRMQRVLDTQTGRTIRLFTCECGEHIWDDGH